MSEFNIEEIMYAYSPEPENTLAILHGVQDKYGYIPGECLKDMSDYLGVSQAAIFADVSFYDAFTTEKQGEYVIKVCDGTACHAEGSGKLLAELEEALGIKSGETTEDGRFTLQTVRCLGKCESAPAIETNSGIYLNVTESNLKDVMDDTLPAKSSNGDSMKIIDSSFERVIMKEAKTLDEYLNQGGFEGLKRALSFPKRRDIIDEVRDSGLRGRSGSAFPVGSKWFSCYNATGRAQNRIDKYVIANGDEGDPGAFMDKWIMENNPYEVLEGMLIAGCAVGANHGYIYIREEYPESLEQVKRAVQEITEAGYAGNKILGSEFSFDFKVVQAAGSYLCGEESGLIESIEGKPGAPRSKPPLPTRNGAFSQPSVVNNIETLANVPLILKDGSEVYRSRGIQTCAGTKMISVSGKVNKTGLVEIPMGKLTLRQLINEICGGMIEGETFSCMQIGGPLGGFITEKDLDTLIDFDSLRAAGATLGSGGIIVMGSEADFNDMFSYIVEFMADESCGTCTPCREGLRMLLEIKERVMSGEFTDADRKLVEQLAQAAKITARCAFGRTIGGPIMSLIKAFDKKGE